MQTDIFEIDGLTAKEAFVKIVASDIDGTLIPYGTARLPEALFPLIFRLREREILFCPASGRQYHSVRQLFAPVADELCYLCENGAIVYGPGAEETAPVLSKTVMPHDDALALCDDILMLPGCDVLISGERSGYICGCGNDLLRDLRSRLANRVQPVNRPEDIPEDLIKVSAFCPNGTTDAEAALGDRWNTVFHMAVAGPVWLDFTLADKGTGLRGLCAALGVPLANMVAFGDNWNDLAMLETAGTAFIMNTADPNLLARFPNHCGNVLETLENMLEES